MKKILTFLAIVTGFAVMTPSISEARDRGRHHHGGYGRSYSHSCRVCSAPIYRERAIVGRDRWGRPITSWRTVGHRCSPRHYHHRHNHRHHNHGRAPGFPFGFRPF